MDIFDHVDQDKAVAFMAFYWWVPFRNWIYGTPHEPVFISQIIGRRRMHGYSWDIGLRKSAIVSHQVANLHQRGPQATDAFGSDFALTIDVRGAFALRKTVIIQTKLGDNCSATVDRSQLQQALAVPQFRGRAFVMALDRIRYSLRLASVDDLAAQLLPGSHQTKSFDTGAWVPTSEWIVQWMRCDLGLPSTGPEAQSIEGLLSRHLVRPPEGFPRYEPADADEETIISVPSFWHHITISIDE